MGVDGRRHGSGAGGPPADRRRWTRRSALTAGAAASATALAALMRSGGGLLAGGGQPRIDPSQGALVDRFGSRVNPQNPPKQPPPAPPPVRTWSIESAGTSVLGRSIECHHSPAPDGERRRILVVAGVHGYERITKPLGLAILGVELPRDVTIWVVPSANPDGWAANTRGNAQGVDLNRNFPWRWRPSDGGPAPASAPETKALMNLVWSTNPDVTVWIHQPLAYVAPLPGCPYVYADAWRAHVGDPRRVGLDQHGGGETWCARVGGVPSMLVEVRSWLASQSLVDAHVRGFEAFVDVVVPRS